MVWILPSTPRLNPVTFSNITLMVSENAMPELPRAVPAQIIMRLVAAAKINLV
jgi:hypothetical protein